MRYISTRGAAPPAPFVDVLLTGIAPDGGLYVPERWPSFSKDELRSLQSADYRGIAFEVLRRFTGDDIPPPDLRQIIDRAYSGFRHAAVAPLRQLAANLWLVELFHGPTLAFKDIALQLLGQLFEYELGRRGERVTILGATSGDTGSAAIEAFRDSRVADLFILHPRGRVSEIQRRQMTTVLSPNIHNLAVAGTFDDCQALIKALFADPVLRRGRRLAAVNSINWARIAAQAVYYVSAGLALGAPDREIAFSVPTGNFGNVYAGDVARRLGLPVASLTIGSNRNDVLTRFCDTAVMQVRDVIPTLSPSMDIQVSSNFERVLFELEGRRGEVVADHMRSLAADGMFRVDAERWNVFRNLYRAQRFDDTETVQWIADVAARTGERLDPHSAIGVAAADGFERPPRHPTVCLATAHPAKFPQALQKALGQAVEPPPVLNDLFRREERFRMVENDIDGVRSAVIDSCRSSC